MGNLVNKILDKINKLGLPNLSYDERNYLKSYNENDINNDLKTWLNSEDDLTYDNDGNKLLYDHFEDDEDIFYNHEKLNRVITKTLNKKSFTNNADWGGANVWGVKTKDRFTGLFIYLGDDDDLVLLKRNLNEDEDYEDEVINTITNTKELNSVFLKTKYLLQ
jgi:hypothetical protein